MVVRRWRVARVKRSREEWAREADRADVAEMVAFGLPAADATDEMKRREAARREADYR